VRARVSVSGALRQEPRCADAHVRASAVSPPIGSD
jgi:hypothetical protein